MNPQVKWVYGSSMIWLAPQSSYTKLETIEIIKGDHKMKERKLWIAKRIVMKHIG